MDPPQPRVVLGWLSRDVCSLFRGRAWSTRRICSKVQQFLIIVHVLMFFLRAHATHAGMAEKRRSGVPKSMRVITAEDEAESQL